MTSRCFRSRNHTPGSALTPYRAPAMFPLTAAVESLSPEWFTAVMTAYDTFAAAAETDALKVVLEAEPKMLEAPRDKTLAGVAG